MKHLTLITIIKEVLQENNSLTEEKILIPRRSPEERRKNFIKATQQKIQQYIKNGSKGDLDLRNTPITSLPDNLKQVGGYLDLSNTPITSLPDNLKHVGGYLDLYNTPITKLPDNLTVGGWLDLNNTPITSLPDNLTVGGDLNLNNTPITKLPDNLTVGGDLWLYNTKITTIPASAKISGKIYGLKQENIMKKSELKQLIKEVLNEVPEEKDKQRIKDMFTKSKGSDEKLLQLAKNMAKSIDDGLKAFRRGEAADVLLGPEDNELSKIFYDRAKELGYEKQVSNQNPNKSTIFLPTYSAITLWKHEITGQLSDGAWENANPWEHWKFWNSLNVLKGNPEVFAVGQRPKRTAYGLTAPSLLDVIGDRMIAGGRLSKALNKILSYDEYLAAEFFLSDDAGNNKVDNVDKLKTIKVNEDFMKKYFNILNEQMVQKFLNTKYDKSDMI